MPAGEGIAVDKLRPGTAASRGEAAGVRVLGVFPGRGKPSLSPCSARGAICVPVLPPAVAIRLFRFDDIVPEEGGEELDGKANTFPAFRIAVPFATLREERGGGVTQGEEEEREEVGVTEGAIRHTVATVGGEIIDDPFEKQPPTAPHEGATGVCSHDVGVFENEALHWKWVLFEAF